MILNKNNNNNQGVFLELLLAAKKKLEVRIRIKNFDDYGHILKRKTIQNVFIRHSAKNGAKNDAYRKDEFLLL